MNYEIQSITIRKPYGARPGDGRPLVGIIELAGAGNEVKVQIPHELIEPIIGVIAPAIAEAGRQAAEAVQQFAADHGATMIEHKPVEKIEG